MKKRFLIGLLFLLCLCVGTACGKDEPEVESLVEAEEEIQVEEIEDVKGDGIFTLSMNMPKTLNPLWNEEETVDRILRLIYQPLVEMDASGKVVEGVAKDWTFQGDGTIISLELYPDILWQNGENLSAYDVAYSLDVIGLAGENSVYHSVLDYISGYQVTGTYTIDIYFHEAFSGNIVALQFPIISKSYYGGNNTPDSGVNMQPMGSGAYYMKSYTMASNMELGANALYREGEPDIKEVKVQIANSNKTDIYAFEQGMLDAVVMEAIGTGRYADDENIQIYPYASRKYDFAGFQFANEWFQNKDMRRVFAYALPRTYIKESIYLNYADITYTPISPKSWLYEENVMNYAYDKQMAATLLKNIGWVDRDGDGILEDAEGNPLMISLLVNEENATRMQIATKWREELQLLGMVVNLDAQPYDVYSQKVQWGDFDIFVGGWEVSAAMNLYDFFGSEGKFNYTGYRDETLEMMIAEANAAVGEGATLLAYSDLQKRIAEELPYISIAYRQDALFLSREIQGTISPVVDNVFASIENWGFVQ